LAVYVIVSVMRGHTNIKSSILCRDVSSIFASVSLFFFLL